MSAVQPLPEPTGAEVPACTREEAEELTATIRHHGGVVWDAMIRAYQGRAWVALDYGTWAEYCRAEFGTDRLSLPRPKRQQTVEELRDAGMSTRAIAAAMGVSKDTVARSLAGVANETPDEPDSSGSRDSEPGRDRPEAAGRDDDGGDVAPPDPSPAPNPAPPRVTGTDGKSYASTTRRNREVMDEAAELMGEQADAKAERLRANYARLHHQFVSGLLALSPEHVAAVLDEAGWEDVERTRQQTEQWFRELVAARPKPFSVIQGGA